MILINKIFLWRTKTQPILLIVCTSTFFDRSFTYYKKMLLFLLPLGYRLIIYSDFPKTSCSTTVFDGFSMAYGATNSFRKSPLHRKCTQIFSMLSKSHLWLPWGFTIELKRLINCVSRTTAKILLHFATGKIKCVNSIWNKFNQNFLNVSVCTKSIEFVF
jgi:hypothetical protein